MNRTTNSAIFALAALGLFYAWRNRSSLQHALESRGIRTPRIGGEHLGERFRSGLARISGQPEERPSRSGRAIRRTA